MTHDAYTHLNNGLNSNTGRKKEKKTGEDILVQKIHFVAERLKKREKPKTLAKPLLSYSGQTIQIIT